MHDPVSGNTKGCTRSGCNPDRPRVHPRGLSRPCLRPSPAIAGSRSKQRLSALRPFRWSLVYPGSTHLSIPALAITLSLTAHLTFGCVSVVIIQRARVPYRACANQGSLKNKTNSSSSVRREPQANKASEGRAGAMSLVATSPPSTKLPTVINSQLRKITRADQAHRPGQACP